jgi:ribosomal protein S18 acetylase RimI-like enzyme
MSEFLCIREFEDADEAEVVRLWLDAGIARPWNDPQGDIVRKRGVQRELFLVATLAGALVATTMAGYDGHRGWVYYVAVRPECRRQGHARALMREVERRLTALGCPKLNLQVRGDNREALAFYARLGYEVEDRVSLGKRLRGDQE